MLTCPFCKKGDFDLIGLRYHLVMCYCEVYNSTPLTNESGPTLRTPDEKPADVQAEIDALGEKLAQNHARLKSAFRQ